jgi:integrase
VGYASEGRSTFVRRLDLQQPDEGRVAPHDLRHSFAGLLFTAGISAPKVAAILRHASPRITLTVYAGLVESQRVDLKDDMQAAFA